MKRLILSLTLLFAAFPASAQQPASSAKSDAAGDHASGVAPAEAPREPKYLVFWGEPQQVLKLNDRIGVAGRGKSRFLAFGLPNTTFDTERTLPDRIRNAFRDARQYDIPVMLHFDFHLRWKERADLWNWFDPKLPGYNPANARNVEWSDWKGTPNKARYLNDGVVERIAPHMCITSAVVRQEIARMVAKVIAPVLKPELDQLKKEGKDSLFAGITAGSEPGIDDYSQPDPETARLMEQDGAPKAPLGYNCLSSRGYSEKNPPKDFRHALAEVNQDFVAFCAKQFVDAGIPSSRLYTHVAAPVSQASTSAPIWIAFNKYSRPGWTTYPIGPLAADLSAIYAELDKHGSPSWGGVEANAGVPGSSMGWEAYLARHFNHGAVLVGVNCGATGSVLPEQLTKSAFGDEAVAAYRKFLSGAPLQSDSKTAADPFAGAFFPPELVLLARDRIALTPEQWEAFRARTEKTQLRSDELRMKLERETAALSVLVKQDRVDEAAVGAQLDRVLDVERELKHLHFGLLSAIKNLLTLEQQAQLREIVKGGGAELSEATRKRVTGKVERVTQGVQKWAANGRDPSAIVKTLEEKVKPLLDAGKAIEAEPELDRLLERLKPDAK